MKQQRTLLDLEPKHKDYPLIEKEQKRYPVKNRIAQVRKSKGISQRDLAKRLGIAPPTLSQIEHNGNPRLMTLAKIAEELNCKIAELIDEQ